MISKEEALSRYGYTECAEEVCIAIEDIYDSRGTCGECVHYRIADEIDEGYEVCTNLGGDYIPIKKDFYCADFERKQS